MDPRSGFSSEPTTTSTRTPRPPPPSFAEARSPSPCSLTPAEPTIGYGPPDPSGASVADFMLWRFYIDGESSASIQIQASQAALIGNASTTAGWGHEYAGKYALFGAWHSNVPIPFQKSIRVTLQLQPWMPVACNSYATFAQVRGVENMPLVLSGLNLPPTARLVASVKNASLPVLAFHDLITLPSGTPGCILAVMIDLTMYGTNAVNTNSLEGCWRGYEPPTAPFPGTIMLGTGAEDYPESAYYFNAGPYHGSTSGMSVFTTSPELSRVSFYKLHHRDPIYFQDGFRLEWRNGDVVDPTTGEKCYALNGPPLFNPTPVNLTSLVYAYTW